MFHVSFIGIEDFLEHVVELDVFGNPFIDSLNEVFAVFIDEGFLLVDDVGAVGAEESCILFQFLDFIGMGVRLIAAASYTVLNGFF